MDGETRVHLHVHSEGQASPPGGPSLHLGKTPELDEANIFTWDDNCYALAVTERLGLEESEGMVRAGPVQYNTQEEVRGFGEALALISNAATRAYEYGVAPGGDPVRLILKSKLVMAICISTCDALSIIKISIIVIGHWGHAIGRPSPHG